MRKLCSDDVLRHPVVAAVLRVWPDAVVTVRKIGGKNAVNDKPHGTGLPDFKSDDHNRAMAAANKRAGQYLDNLDKTDLATLSVEEWRVFLQVVGTSYVTALYQTIDDEIPF